MAFTVSNLPHPVKKQFTAARMVPCVPKWLKANLQYLEYFSAPRIPVKADCDYRYVQVGDRDALLVTPKGLPTHALKQELYNDGWLVFLENHPDFEVFTKDQIDVMKIPLGFVAVEPVLVFARSIKTGKMCKAAILYPRVEIVGQRHA